MLEEFCVCMCVHVCVCIYYFNFKIIYTQIQPMSLFAWKAFLSFLEPSLLPSGASPVSASWVQLMKR